MKRQSHHKISTVVTQLFRRCGRASSAVALVLSASLIVSACSSQTQIPSDTLHRPNQVAKSSANTRYASHTDRSRHFNDSPSRALWIWIAPEYRSQLPEGAGAYLIETITP